MPLSAATPEPSSATTESGGFRPKFPKFGKFSTTESARSTTEATTTTTTTTTTTEAPLSRNSIRPYKSKSYNQRFAPTPKQSETTAAASTTTTTTTLATTEAPATETSAKPATDGPTSKLPPPAALDTSVFELDGPPVFKTAFFDVDSIPGKSNANAGLTVDTTSFDVGKDTYDSYEEDDDVDNAPYAKLDEPKTKSEAADSAGSRLPIRNVLDVFQELKLAFGRS